MEIILPWLVASIYIIIFCISIFVVLKRHGGAPFFLVFSTITIITSSLCGFLRVIFNVNNIPQIAAPLHLLSLCIYALSILGLSIIFVDEMSLIHAIPQLLAYRVRKIIIIGSLIIFFLTLILGGISHAISSMTVPTNVSSTPYFLSMYICPSTIYILLLIISILQYISSRRVLLLLSPKTQENNDDQPNGENKTVQSAAGFSSGEVIKAMTGIFQRKLIKCFRRLSFSIFWVSCMGLTSMSQQNTNQLLCLIFQTLMDVGIQLSMFDILTSTMYSLWGQEADEGGTENKYSQETNAAIFTLDDIIDASSSEDEEEMDNTFFFPIAIRHISINGPLSQSRRLSVK
jgi:hypothetical protein